MTMIFTADQLVAHLVGDYIFQSDWMASEKTKRTTAAALHAVAYTASFIWITQSIAALAIICITHFLIDRFRLARFVVRIKNEIGNPWRQRRAMYDTPTGYPADMPPWMAVWLLIIADNTLHIVINGLAIHFAG